MNALLLILAFFLQADLDEEIAPAPPPPKLELIIFVNEYNKNEAYLKNTFTKKWMDRINPNIRATLPKSVLQKISELDTRTAILKESCNFTFIERNRTLDKEFGLRIGKYSHMFYKLPSEVGMCEPGHWLSLFEYIVQEYEYPARYEKWDREISEIKAEFYQKEYSDKWIYCTKKLQEKIDSETDGGTWFHAKGGGLFYNKGTESKFHSAEELGFMPKPEPKWEKAPIRPKNPFPNDFKFLEKETQDKLVPIPLNIMPEVPPEPELHDENPTKE